MSTHDTGDARVHGARDTHVAVHIRIPMNVDIILVDRDVPVHRHTGIGAEVVAMDRRRTSIDITRASIGVDVGADRGVAGPDPILPECRIRIAVQVRARR
jgi:hypothetical protein